MLSISMIYLSGRVEENPSITASTATGMANVLLSAPHCIPFEERVQVFRGLITADREANRWDLPPIEGGPPPIQVGCRARATYVNHYYFCAIFGTPFISFEKKK